MRMETDFNGRVAKGSDDVFADAIITAFSELVEANAKLTPAEAYTLAHCRLFFVLRAMAALVEVKDKDFVLFCIETAMSMEKISMERMEKPAPVPASPDREA